MTRNHSGAYNAETCPEFRRRRAALRQS